MLLYFFTCYFNQMKTLVVECILHVVSNDFTGQSVSSFIGFWSNCSKCCFPFFDCSAGSYKNGQIIEHSDCKPWVEDTYWEIKRSNNAIIEEAYKQFNGEKTYRTAFTITYHVVVSCVILTFHLFLQMFFMNADSSTTELSMWFHKLKDLWAWRSSQSSMPFKLG